VVGCVRTTGRGCACLPACLPCLALPCLLAGLLAGLGWMVLLESFPEGTRAVCVVCSGVGVEHGWLAGSPRPWEWEPPLGVCTNAGGWCLVVGVQTGESERWGPGSYVLSLVFCLQLFKNYVGTIIIVFSFFTEICAKSYLVARRGTRTRHD
jgi:hypothetical protein